MIPTLLALSRRSLALALAMLTACGSTLAKVPHLTANDVSFRGLFALAGQALTLQVVDERPTEMRSNQKELEAALHALFAQILTENQLDVTEGAPLHLVIRVSDARDFSETRGYRADRCLALRARLSRGEAFSAEAAAFACHQVHNGLGMTVGGNISEAYRMAIQELLRLLDAQLRHLPNAALHADAPASAQQSFHGSIARLSVRVTPAAARVWIDGVARGIGDVDALMLASGPHTITVEAAGLTPFQNTIRLPPDQYRELSVALQAPKEEHNIQSREGYGWLWMAITIGIAAGLSTGVATALRH